jgi:hypothetical protein
MGSGGMNSKIPDETERKRKNRMKQSILNEASISGPKKVECGLAAAILRSIAHIRFQEWLSNDSPGLLNPR